MFAHTAPSTGSASQLPASTIRSKASPEPPELPTPPSPPAAIGVTACANACCGVPRNPGPAYQTATPSRAAKVKLPIRFIQFLLRFLAQCFGSPPHHAEALPVTIHF